MSTEHKSTGQSELGVRLGGFWNDFKQGKVIGYKWMAIILILVSAIGVSWYVISERRAATSHRWVEEEEANTIEKQEEISKKYPGTMLDKLARLQIARSLLGESGLEQLAANTSEQRTKGIENIEKAREMFQKLVEDFKNDRLFKSECYLALAKSEATARGCAHDARPTHRVQGKVPPPSWSTSTNWRRLPRRTRPGPRTPRSWPTPCEMNNHPAPMSSDAFNGAPLRSQDARTPEVRRPAFPTRGAGRPRLAEHPRPTPLSGKRIRRSPISVFHVRRTRRRSGSRAGRADAEHPVPRTPRPPRHGQVRRDAARPVRPLHLARTSAARKCSGRSKPAASRSTAGRSKPSYKVRKDDQLHVEMPEPTHDIPVPEDIPLDILYQDEWLAVVNKPPDMVVHPAKGNWSGTLVNALQFHFRDHLSTGERRSSGPGIVHRLDKDTSGVILVAKDDRTHRDLAMQFETRKVFKEYVAIVAGRTRPRHRLHRGGASSCTRTTGCEMIVSTDPDDGRKAALSYYEVLERFRGFTLVKVQPRTGRTHQIRVHLRARRLPGAGRQDLRRPRQLKLSDLVAGLPPGEDGVLIGRQALHAFRLRFRHPRTEQWIEAEAPLPADMRRVLDAVADPPAVAVAAELNSTEISSCTVGKALRSPTFLFVVDLARRLAGPTLRLPMIYFRRLVLPFPLLLRPIAANQRHGGDDEQERRRGCARSGRSPR